jgi:hypothetical protein
MDIVSELRNLVAEVPEAVGEAFVFIGKKLEELAARIDTLEAEKKNAPPS